MMAIVEITTKKPGHDNDNDDCDDADVNAGEEEEDDDVDYAGDRGQEEEEVADDEDDHDSVAAVAVVDPYTFRGLRMLYLRAELEIPNFKAVVLEVPSIPASHDSATFISTKYPLLPNYDLSFWHPLHIFIIPANSETNMPKPQPTQGELFATSIFPASRRPLLIRHEFSALGLSR